MNVKVSFQFNLCNTATPASEVIARPGKSSLTVPVWAVVILDTFSPFCHAKRRAKAAVTVRRLNLKHFEATQAALANASLAVPFFPAGLGAKTVMFFPRQPDPVCFAALFALFVNSLLHLGFFAPRLWPGYALLCLAGVYAKALRGTEVMVNPVFLGGIKAKGFATGLASYLVSILFSLGNRRHGALMRAVLAGYAAVVAKDLAAVEASGVNLLTCAYMFTKAFLRTEPASLAGLINGIRFAALFAGQLNLSIFHRVIIA